MSQIRASPRRTRPKCGTRTITRGLMVCARHLTDGPRQSGCQCVGSFLSSRTDTDTAALRLRPLMCRPNSARIWQRSKAQAAAAKQRVRRVRMQRRVRRVRMQQGMRGQGVQLQRWQAQQHLCGRRCRAAAPPESSRRTSHRPGAEPPRGAHCETRHTAAAHTAAHSEPGPGWAWCHPSFCCLNHQCPCDS